MNAAPPHSFAKRRLNRIFAPDGRTLIVAMDHLSKLGRGPILRDAGRVIPEVVAGGSDVILARQGLILRHAEALARVGLLLAVDDQPPTHDYAVELALRLGVDGIKILCFPGAPNQPDSRAQLARMIAACLRFDLPVLAEMIPVGFGAPEMTVPEHLASVARLGADMGADFIKVPYSGDPDSFRAVVETAERPVVILGGGSGSVEQLLTAVRGALDAGAAGAAIGRRVWSHPRPGHVTAALARLIHEDLSVDRALAEATRVTVG